MGTLCSCLSTVSNVLEFHGIGVGFQLPGWLYVCHQDLYVGKGIFVFS